MVLEYLKEQYTETSARYAEARKPVNIYRVVGGQLDVALYAVNATILVNGLRRLALCTTVKDVGHYWKLFERYELAHMEDSPVESIASLRLVCKD